MQYVSTIGIRSRLESAFSYSPRPRMTAVQSLEAALSLQKPAYGLKCKKVWLDFVEYSSDNFDDKAPQEEKLIDYFKQLRENKKLASSTLWVQYSYLNTIIKNRYGTKLQSFPRITTLLKSYDTDVKKKAGVFETKDIDAFIEHPNRSPYWLVRKVIIIVAYFGGLISYPPAKEGG